MQRLEAREKAEAEAERRGGRRQKRNESARAKNIAEERSKTWLRRSGTKRRCVHAPELGIMQTIIRVGTIVGMRRPV